jgi:hypothetical protein
VQHQVKHAPHIHILGQIVDQADLPTQHEHAVQIDLDQLQIFQIFCLRRKIWGGRRGGSSSRPPAAANAAGGTTHAACRVPHAAHALPAADAGG